VERILLTQRCYNVFNFFRNIYLLWHIGPEIDAFAQTLRAERLAAEKEAAKYHLNLCVKHQQERNHCHYSEGNCHYCKLLKESL
jgi:hypothetical protein